VASAYRGHFGQTVGEYLIHHSHHTAMPSAAPSARGRPACLVSRVQLDGKM
jgi:hypothetical protein